MTDVLEIYQRHPGIPGHCVPVKAHSRFGSDIGYMHYIDNSADTEETYYLGLHLGDKHAGAPGRGHGGVTMTMLDEVMGRAACRALNKLCYTASMTTNFCNGSKLGEFLLATAQVTRAGRNIVFVDAKLRCDTTIIATATGSWANSGLDIPYMGNIM